MPGNRPDGAFTLPSDEAIRRQTEAFRSTPDGRALGAAFDRLSDDEQFAQAALEMQLLKQRDPLLHQHFLSTLTPEDRRKLLGATAATHRLETTGDTGRLEAIVDALSAPALLKAMAATSSLLAIASFARWGLTGQGMVGAVFMSLLVLIAAVDLKLGIVSNKIVLTGAGAVVFLLATAEPSRLPMHLLAGCGAFIAFLAVAALTDGLGMGNAKLALLLGVGLGAGILLSLFLASLAVCTFATFLVARGRGRDIFEFPAFLCAAAAIAYLVTGW